MRIRVLSEWGGSPRCGTVCDWPTADALVRIAGGWAEAVGDAPVFETQVMAPVIETAVAPERAPRRGKGR